MRKMKGLAIKDIMITAVVLAIISIIVTMMLVINIINSLTSEPQGFVVSFIKTVNEPFSVFEGLSHMQYRNRQLFEHFLAAAVTGSLQKAGSSGAESALSDFVGSYEKPVYILALSSKDSIFQITNVRGAFVESFSCGDNAYCTDNEPDGFRTAGGVCQVGKVPFSQGQGRCKQGQTCCKYDIKAYSDSTPPQGARKFGVVACGKNQAGICNPIAFKSDATTIRTGPKQRAYCGNGFVIIEDVNKDCENANNGLTPTCCAPAVSTALEQARVTSKAEVPFLYKGQTLFESKEYYCQDTRAERCSGEYARIKDFCGSDSNVKCCITEEIRCKPPNEKYFCMDVEHCAALGGDVVENQCPDPEPSNYRCCILQEPKPYKESASGSSPKFNKGTCYLEGIPYNAKPVLGKLEVSIG